MPIRNILVPICPDVEFDHQLDVALSLARRMEAHVNAVYIRPDPVVTLASIPEVAIAAGATVELIEREEQGAEAAARAKFESWRALHGLSCGIVDQSLRTPFACWSEQMGSIEAAVVRCGRLSDLIVLNRPDPYEAATERAFDAAVFDTGRPTILLPAEIPNNPLRHVIVAWNGSLEATRAVAGAMSLLHEAERISVFTAPRHAEDSPNGLDLVGFLTWHGILAGSFTPRADEASVGASLLRVADDCRATLLVMGGYTHSRVRQLFLGGVTSHVLRHAKVPVLMMH